MAGLGDVQNSIYLGGLSGARPVVPVDAAALREAAGCSRPADLVLA